MKRELKIAIINWLLDNENAWQRVNTCKEYFKPYIYKADGSYNDLIGGKEVGKFISDADRLLYSEKYLKI